MFKEQKRNWFQKIIFNIQCRFYRLWYLFWEIRYFIVNILFGKGYVKEFIRLVDYDYKSILGFQCFQLRKLRHAILRGHEEEESRMSKVKSIDRVIVLMQHIIDDDYLERCGWDRSRSNISFIDIKDTDLCEMVDTHPNKYSIDEFRAISNKAYKLKITEMRQMYDILNNESLGWWD